MCLILGIFNFIFVNLSMCVIGYENKSCHKIMIFPWENFPDANGHAFWKLFFRPGGKCETNKTSNENNWIRTHSQWKTATVHTEAHEESLWYQKPSAKKRTHFLSLLSRWFSILFSWKQLHSTHKHSERPFVRYNNQWVRVRVCAEMTKSRLALPHHTCTAPNTRTDTHANKCA